MAESTFRFAMSQFSQKIGFFAQFLSTFLTIYARIHKILLYNFYKGRYTIKYHHLKRCLALY